MKKKSFLAPALLFLSFALWTVLVRIIDTDAIGPLNSTVGFAKLNGFVHGIIGENLALYRLTDILSVIPIFICLCFAALGLSQAIGRKSLLKVDASLLLLGGFYISVMTVYVFFELVPINCRPVLIDGRLEVSYPSSTTVLFMTVIPAALIEVRRRVKSRGLFLLFAALGTSLTVFAVICRIMSGVHWISDIIGGALISLSLVLTYRALIKTPMKINTGAVLSEKL